MDRFEMQSVPTYQKKKDVMVVRKFLESSVILIYKGYLMVLK